MSKALIIGAGFSFPLGLPLANQVIPWLRQCSPQDTDNPFSTEEGVEIKFWLEEAKACGIISEPIDFEEFLAFLKPAGSVWKQLTRNRSFPRPNKDWAGYISWPPHPDRVAKSLVQRFLYKIYQFHDAHFGQPDFFEPAINLFAKLLDPGDVILTFNFDSVVERASIGHLGEEGRAQGSELTMGSASTTYTAALSGDCTSCQTAKTMTQNPRYSYFNINRRRGSSERSGGSSI